MTGVVVTVIGRTAGSVGNDVISAFETIVRENDSTIVRPHELSAGRVIDLYLDANAKQIPKLQSSLDSLSSQYPVDVIVQQVGELRRNKGLFVFDMDSTLIQQEVIDLIAAHAGVEKEVSQITEQAMNGEIDFKESFNKRVGLLKGLPADVFEQIKPNITFTPGAKSLTAFLRSKGIKTAVLSGGFLPLANWVKETLGLDYAHANVLELTNDKTQLTGKPLGEIVDGARKAVLLQEIAKENGIPLDKVVAVGDGSNDLPMMGVAGWGVAWRAKKIVQEKAPSKLNTENLQDILYILGYSEEEQKL